MTNKYINALVVLLAAGVCLAASIDAVKVMPNSAPTGSAVTIAATAQIDDPSVIASSVNLQKVDSQGRTLAVIGPLVDNGSDGDAVAGDRVFTIRFTLLPIVPEMQTYRVSAGVLGSLNRIFSAPVSFTSTGPATGIAITQPSNLAFVGLSQITVAGTIGDRSATVTVNGISAVRNGNSFQTSVPLQEGNNTITAVAANSNNTTNTASIQVTLDTTPPRVTIDSPEPNSTTTESSVTVTGIVNDIVVGTVNGQQATVTVNSVPAEVGNRRYVARSVPVAPGENNLHVIARDQTGNSATLTAKVMREAAGPQVIKLVSGNHQSGPAGTALPSPLVVQLTSAGAPVPATAVIFKVVENDGTLQPGKPNSQIVIVNTDAQGQAKAALTLGHRYGAASNIVQAYASGFQGIATFTATGVPGPAAEINIDSGNNQFGAVGQALAVPLVAVVSDAGHNRLANIPVTFSVKQGGGSIGGQSTLEVNTDEDGRASVVLTLGSQPGQDNNVIEANFEGGRTLPATFTASAKAPGDPARTTISGVVLDNSANPIHGATIRLFRTNQGSNNNQPLQVGTPVVTDAKGVFRVSPAPVGFFKLMADGTTATLGGRTFPTLEYDIVTVPGQDNGVGMPIYLPALDPASRVCVSPTTGGEVKIPTVPGFSLKVLPGSATFAGGSKTGCVSATPVNPDKIPMVPGFGLQPRFIVTIQPVGTTFNPPAAMTIPNVQGLPPRAKTEMYSYDHDLASFVTVGSATVSADGSVISSDPGVGIVKAGWDSIGQSLPSGSVAPVSVSIVSFPGSDVVPVGDTVFFAARAAPEGGTFAWKAEDIGTATALSIQGSSTNKDVQLKANELGRSRVSVRYTSNSTDANGVHPVAHASFEVETYDIDSIEVKAIVVDGYVTKPNRAATEVELPVEAKVVVNVDGVVQEPHFPVNLRYRFADPDDTSNKPGIDANGNDGNDNAPVAKGGKRGAGSVMWRSVPGYPSQVEASGQAARAQTLVSSPQQGRSKITFLTSAIGGDNYIIHVEAVDSRGRVMKKAVSGETFVRKTLVFDNLYQVHSGTDILCVMDEKAIEPAFDKEGRTDYFLGALHQIPAGPNSPEFMAPVSPPTAAELPTAQELADYSGVEAIRKALAKIAIEKKAMAWHERNDKSVGAALRNWIKANGVVAPAVVGIRFLHPKNDGNVLTGNTNFYPPGIEIPAGDLTPAGAALVDPDAEWGETLGIELKPETVAFIPLNAKDRGAEKLQRTGRHEAGHASDHVSFGPGDHTTEGLMTPAGEELEFSDDSILRLRGWKR